MNKTVASHLLPLVAVVMIGFGFCPALAGAAQSIRIPVGAGGSHQSVTLGLNKTQIVELDTSAREAVVANPEIVDAVVKTPRRIYLMAKKLGQTNAVFLDAQGRKLLVLDIAVERDVGEINAMLRAELPGSMIEAKAINDNVVLSGRAASPIDAKRAFDIAVRFAGDPKKVVSMVRTAAGEQVMLKVRIAEMERSVSKQLGIDLAGAVTSGGVPINLSTSNPYGLTGQALSDLSYVMVGSSCTADGSGCTGGRNNVSGTAKALETIGLMRTLAEPNLIAVSGETAKFLAGGEFPVPTARDRDGNITVTFKQFGVGLSFTPVVLGPGNISLQISTEVSELTNTGSYTITTTTDTSATSTMTIPALQVRRTETTVELPSGGSFAVAGLIQQNTKQVLAGFPGAKDLPILGALFRSRDFQNNETELVVIVTAYLVDPVQERKLVAPTDGFVTPSDPETLLLGRLNHVYSRDKAPPKPSGAVGFLVP